MYIKEIISIIFVFVISSVIVFSLLYPALLFISCKKVEVYNRINNTTYSCSDYLWASDQINNLKK